MKQVTWNNTHYIIKQLFFSKLFFANLISNFVSTNFQNFHKLRPISFCSKSYWHNPYCWLLVRQSYCWYRLTREYYQNSIHQVTALKSFKNAKYHIVFTKTNFSLIYKEINTRKYACHKVCHCTYGHDLAYWFVF